MMKQGERYGSLVRRDAKGGSAAIELTHVIQLRPTHRRNARGKPVETLTLNSEPARWD